MNKESDFELPPPAMGGSALREKLRDLDEGRINRDQLRTEVPWQTWYDAHKTGDITQDELEKATHFDDWLQAFKDAQITLYELTLGTRGDDWKNAYLSKDNKKEWRVKTNFLPPDPQQLDPPPTDSELESLTGPRSILKLELWMDVLALRSVNTKLRYHQLRENEDDTEIMTRFQDNTIEKRDMESAFKLLDPTAFPWNAQLSYEERAQTMRGALRDLRSEEAGSSLDSFFDIRSELLLKRLGKTKEYLDTELNALMDEEKRLLVRQNKGLWSSSRQSASTTPELRLLSSSSGNLGFQYHHTWANPGGIDKVWMRIKEFQENLEKEQHKRGQQDLDILFGNFTKALEKLRLPGAHPDDRSWTQEHCDNLRELFSNTRKVLESWRRNELELLKKTNSMHTQSFSLQAFRERCGKVKETREKQNQNLIQASDLKFDITDGRVTGPSIAKMEQSVELLAQNVSFRAQIREQRQRLEAFEQQLKIIEAVISNKKELGESIRNDLEELRKIEKESPSALMQRIAIASTAQSSSSFSMKSTHHLNGLEKILNDQQQRSKDYQIQIDDIQKNYEKKWKETTTQLDIATKKLNSLEGKLSSPVRITGPSNEADIHIIAQQHALTSKPNTPFEVVDLRNRKGPILPPAIGFYLIENATNPSLSTIVLRHHVESENGSRMTVYTFLTVRQAHQRQLDKQFLAEIVDPLHLPPSKPRLRPVRVDPDSDKLENPFTRMKDKATNIVDAVREKKEAHKEKTAARKSAKRS